MKTFSVYIILYSFAFGITLNAQAPWCDGSHYYQNSSLGGYSPTNYVIALEQVRIRQGNSILYDHAADGYSGNVNCGQEYRLSNPSSKAFTLTSGYTYTIDASSSSAYTYYANFGAYIDLNNDKDFLDAGEYLGTWSSTNNGAFNISALKSKDILIPCSAKLGATRLRIVCNYNAYTMNASYGCTSCSGPPYYGETLDMSIVIDKPNSLNVDFLVPNTIWIKTVKQFINMNQIGYFNHIWDINNDGTIEQNGNIPNYTVSAKTWTSPGNKCIKLKSSNCLGSDSIVKCFQVKSPSSTPIADFISNSTQINQYEVVKLYDLSQNGPWKWQWDVYDSVTYSNIGYYPSLSSGDVIADPSGNGSNEWSATPEFEFDVPGCYTLVLTATNDVGPSQAKIKTCYIHVTLPNDFKLGFGVYGRNGDNYVESPNGSIADNGGKFFNYDNNQGMGARSFLCIKPCNAKKIKLHLSQLKFKDGIDKLSIWDGSSASGPNTTLLGTYGYLSKAPKDLVATSGSMFILFESDANGTDSGFYGEYTSELGPPNLPVPSFTVDNNPLYNSKPAHFTNTTQNFSGLPSWEWTVNGLQILNNKNKDLNTSFSADGTYNVCLKMNSCAGFDTACQNLQVITPNTQTTLDIKASKYRPNIHEPIQLKLLSSSANRFEIQIYPTTYKLLNPPSGPSTYGSGFIKYNATPGDTMPMPVLQFENSGCYQITIKAYNHLDPVNTTKTIVKNDFICALDYCRPDAYILASDIGINHVKLQFGPNVIFDKHSPSGLKSYNDYTDTLPIPMTYCQTFGLTIERNTFKDSVKTAAYIDWNIDGDFEDPGEMILNVNQGLNGTIHSSFVTPPFSSSFEGLSRLRIVTSYINDPISPCGPLKVAEFEDYPLLFYRDSKPPVITKIGPDTVYIKVGENYVDQGATAFDDIEGNITVKMALFTNYDPQVTGLYETYYKVCDCSGTCSESKRTIIVYNVDTVIMALNQVSSTCIEAKRNNDPYVDPGAIAYSLNPYVNYNASIQIKGSVDTRKTGQYKLEYLVWNLTGYTSKVTRFVCVEDHVKPIIYAPLDTNVQLGGIWIDPTEVKDDYDDNIVLEKNWRLNKPVNTYDKTIYTVTYTAHDQSDNEADTVYRNYRVDDFIPPLIQLNTEDIVFHPVRQKYESIPVSVSDNYYGPDKTIVRLISSDVNENVLGEYHEIFEATDGSNNISIKTRTVFVIDKIAPRIWGPPIYSCVGENIWPYWGLLLSDNYNTFNELKPFIEIIKQDVNVWEEGIYSITYTVTDQSGNRSEPFLRYVQITFPPSCNNSSTGIEDKDYNDLIKLYPNPTQGILNIEFRHSDKETANISICDMTGRSVYETNMDQNMQTLDLNGLPAGIYMVNIRIGDAVIRRQISICR